MNATIVFQKNWEAINARNPDGSRKYRYIINTGSSRSSKTYSLLQSHYLTAFSNDNYRISIWRETKQDVKNTVLSDFRKALPTFDNSDCLNFNKTESIFTFPNNSTIEICGGDDTNRVHGFQGDVAHFNEPYKMPKEVFDQIDMRTSDYIVIDWNPKASHWIEELSKQENAIVIHSTFKDNPYVPHQQKIKILSYEPNEYNKEQGTANEWMWQVYGLGLKAEKPNRIFSWAEISDQEYHALNVPKYIGVDWGKVDPWGIVEAKYLDGCLYLHELNYDSENKWRDKINDQERSKVSILDKDDSNAQEGIVIWLFDKLGIDKKLDIVCDNNRPTKIASLRRRGYNAFPAFKGSGSIIDGIDTMQNLKVFYTKSSTNIAYEQENYSYKVDRYGIVLDEPEDADNHCIDPSRYLVSHLVSKGIIKVL